MRLLTATLVLALTSATAGAQGAAVVDPGMSKAQVIAKLGAPAAAKSDGDATYLYYRNGCEKTCGMSDLVILEKDAVVDAVFRSPKRSYSGKMSSPRAIPADEARKAKPTTDAGNGTVVAMAGVTAIAKKASLYDRIGGQPAVKAAVHEMVTNAMADDRIKAFFAGIDMERVDRNLVDFVCQAAGGPCTYKGKTMPKAHEGLNLKPAHFDALVQDLKKGLDKLKVPDAEQKELLAALAATRKDVLGK